MNGPKLWRPVTAAEYGKARDGRLMPDQLVLLGDEPGAVSTVRIRWPEGHSPPSSPDEFGREFAALVTEKEWRAGRYEIAVAWKPRGDVEVAEMLLSEGGLIIAEDQGMDDLEMGYFVGATDPWDVGLSVLTRERPLVPA